MEKKRIVTYIYCEDGMVVRGSEGQIYWSWEFKFMDNYGKQNDSSNIAKKILADMIHNRDLGYTIEVVYREQSIRDIM